MARPLRIEFADACYHVINRGNFRHAVFAEERDRQLFMDKLETFLEPYRIRVRAWCVQVNHFHLFLQTAEPNLGRFMQAFLTSFTVSYNRRHTTSGHVFQGRYKAFLVEDESRHCDEVSRYIHLNPACIPSVRDAPFGQRRCVVRECLWTSYASILGLRRCPAWLDRRAVLRGWGRTLAERRTGYAAFVEQGLTEKLWDPYEAAAAQAVIGSDSFVDRMRRSLTDLTENINVRRESTETQALAAWVELDRVLDAVANHYGCTRDSLVQRHNRGHLPRQVALYLAATYCRGRNTLSDLGHQLGPITVGALCAARCKLSCALAEDRDLKADVNTIAAELTR